MRSVYPVHLIRRLAAQLCQKEVVQNRTWLSSKDFDKSQFLCGRLEMMINAMLRLACPSLYEYRSWMSFLQWIFGKRQFDRPVHAVGSTTQTPWKSAKIILEKTSAASLEYSRRCSKIIGLGVRYNRQTKAGLSVLTRPVPWPTHLLILCVPGVTFPRG